MMLFNFLRNCTHLTVSGRLRDPQALLEWSDVETLCQRIATTCPLNEASVDSSDHTSNPESQLPQSIQNAVGSVESDKDQCADGKTDLTISQECTDLEVMNVDENGPDIMDSSHSGIDLHENQLSEQNKDEPTAYNRDYMITNQPSGDMLTLGLSFGTETQSVNDTQSQSLLNEESSDYYIQNPAHEPHLYWTGAVEGAAVDYTPQTVPGALQSQLMPCSKLNEPREGREGRDDMPTEQNVCMLLVMDGPSFIGWWCRTRLVVSASERGIFDSLFILVSWTIWKERNRRTFDTIHKTMAQTVSSIREEFAKWEEAGFGVPRKMPAGDSGR